MRSAAAQQDEQNAEEAGGNQQTAGIGAGASNQMQMAGSQPTGTNVAIGAPVTGMDPRQQDQ